MTYTTQRSAGLKSSNVICDASPLVPIIMRRGYERGAEIGVWRGESSRYLAPLLGKLYLVDSWQPFYLAQRRGPSSLVEMDAIYYSVYGIFEHNPNVEVLRMSSVDASSIVPHDLDFVFLDAEHDYEGVKRNISAWREHIRRWGILCGDDYTHHDNGVKRAVDEAFGDKVKHADTNTWAFFSADAAHMYNWVCRWFDRFWYVEHKDL